VSTSADGAACAVENLVVRFDTTDAVAGIDFTVSRGEVFGLLGPNGAGKTTTLRVLTTLLKPTTGRAFVIGHDVRREGIRVRSLIGYVPQAISVDAALTGTENLEFYARVTGVPKRKRPARIDDAIETMGIGSFVGKLARTLSGGMLRRLEIATALLNRPAVLFLDEPTVGLDPTARRAVWERLRLLGAEAGTTILVTTHQMEEAESECERVAIMDRGHLAALGTPADLRAQTGELNLDGVFASVTGHELASEGGSYRHVRAQRRLARRLG
jgi:ABC-2 type transport system ATP-binding protein